MKANMSKLTNALAIGEHGKFLAQGQLNPRGKLMTQASNSEETNSKEVNVITTRSGKTIESINKHRKEKRSFSNSKEDRPNEEVIETPTRAPFPQALKPTLKATGQHNEILEHLKHVKINLPILHVITQVPTYAKVLKDLYTIKRKHHVKKIAFLTEYVSSVIQQRTPPKYKDPGCPTIYYIIRNHEVAQALLDLGASVNLMSYAIYSLLGLGKIKPTSVVLQLVDRSTVRPRGVVEDLLVQINKFYYPVDFLVLDLKADVKVDSKISIILGRPFLATANTLTNYKNGLMKLSFGNMTLEVNIFHITKQPQEDDEYHQTFMIDALTQEETPATIDFDHLNSFLLNSKISSDIDNEEYADMCTIFAKM